MKREHSIPMDSRRHLRSQRGQGKMRGAEYYGLKENFGPDNKDCTDWTFDSGYGQTFGKQVEQEYINDIKKDWETCGHCLYVDTGFCTFAER